MLTDLFKIFYKIFKNPTIAFYGAVLYITVIIFSIAQGLVFMMKEIIELKSVLAFLVFPFNIGWFILLLIYFYKKMPARRIMSRRDKRKKMNAYILVLTIMAVVSYGYIVIWNMTKPVNPRLQNHIIGLPPPK